MFLMTSAQNRVPDEQVATDDYPPLGREHEQNNDWTRLNCRRPEKNN